MASAINHAFHWEETNQGRLFWLSVLHHFAENEPLPPLPAEYYWKRLALAAGKVLSYCIANNHIPSFPVKELEELIGEWEELKNQQI
jgi:hypothetical protein